MDGQFGGNTQPVVLRYEGAHRRGRNYRSGAQRGDDGGERGGRDTGGAPAAWPGESGVCRRRLHRRAKTRQVTASIHGLVFLPFALASNGWTVDSRPRSTSFNK
jgi:hypothetical protein